MIVDTHVTLVVEKLGHICIVRNGTTGTMAMMHATVVGVIH